MRLTRPRPQAVGRLLALVDSARPGGAMRPLLLCLIAAGLVTGCYSSTSIVGSGPPVDAVADTSRPDEADTPVDTTRPDLPDTSPPDIAEFDEPSCIPSCAGLECGDDGCGGSCGTCSDSEFCFDGLCDLPDCAWRSLDFEPPYDSMLCDGNTFVRFDEIQGLWVGVIQCDLGLRVFLSSNMSGPYFPAADGGGHGQDFCELIRPGFWLYDEDDITSGGCFECSILDTWASFDTNPHWWRYACGELFIFDPDGDGLDFASIVDCAVDVSVEPGATLFCY